MILKASQLSSNNSTTFIIICLAFCFFYPCLSETLPETTLKADKDVCKDMVERWITNPLSLLESQFPTIVYADSGKFLNDLGDYNNCQFNSDNYTYFTMSLVNVLLKNYQYMGLCAPKMCAEEISSQSFAKDIENMMNQMIKNLTNTTTNQIVKLYFYDPVTVQPTFDWSNYLAIAFICTLVLLGIIGSFVSKATESQTMPVKVIKCFSLYDNFKKILTLGSTSENQNLLFLNGARIISICWIIFGHDQWFRFSNIKNWTQTLDILTTPGIATLVPAAYFAVDTFFWIGGFLITLSMIEPLKKIKNLFSFYAGCVLHRFIRIWPTYMVGILLYWKIAPYLGSGPIWQSFYNFTSSCNDGGILWNMFFLDNFADHGNGTDYCFGWGWYLAVDFQLFMITPFILYAYVKNKKIGWILTFVLFLASVVSAFVIILVKNFRYPIPNPIYPPQPKFMDEFYYKPYVRASAYFMGIFSGFIYVQWKDNNEAYVRVINKIKNSIFWRVMFYVIGISLIQFIIWIIVPYQTGSDWSSFTQAIYNSLNRVVFLIGVYLCVFAAMFGCKNDPSKFILGHPLFGPLAKVSFCVYLVHFIVIMNGTYSARMDMFWTTSSSLYVIITDIFWSFVLAACLSALIQSPILGLQKIFLRGGHSKKKKEGEAGKKIDFKQDNHLNDSLLAERDRPNKNQYNLSEEVRVKVEQPKLQEPLLL